MQSPETPSGADGHTPSCCAPTGALPVDMAIGGTGPAVPEPVGPPRAPAAPAGRSGSRAARSPWETVSTRATPPTARRPTHPVTLAPYLLDATAVTNAQFATFAKATGYVTEAEEIGISAVFHLAVAGVATRTSPAAPRARRGGWRCAAPTGGTRPARSPTRATSPTTPSST